MISLRSQCVEGESSNAVSIAMIYLSVYSASVLRPYRLVMETPGERWEYDQVDLRYLASLARTLGKHFFKFNFLVSAYSCMV